MSIIYIPKLNYYTIQWRREKVLFMEQLLHDKIRWVGVDIYYIAIAHYFEILIILIILVRTKLTLMYNRIIKYDRTIGAIKGDVVRSVAPPPKFQTLLVPMDETQKYRGWYIPTCNYFIDKITSRRH